jgi:fibronectin-binding autotransporter adhesin
MKHQKPLSKLILQFRPYFSNPFRVQSLIGMATVALAFPSNLSAANYQWDINDSTAGLGGTGTWDTTNTFWDLLALGADDGSDATTAYTFTNADLAVFGGTAGTVTLGTGITVNGLRIDTAGYVITGNTLTLAGTTPTITANANATISSILAGTAGLVKTGTGTIAIGTQATYTGGTIINTNGGILDLTGGGGISGTIRGAITVNTGGTLRLSTGDATGYATDATRLSQINLVGGTLDVNTTSNQTLGSAVINMTGGSMTGVTNSNLDFFAGSSTLNALAAPTTSTIGGLRISIRQTGGLTITVADGAAASDLSISSVIAGNTSFAAAPLIKAGAGNLTLSGANTYTGATIVNAGTLTLSRSAGFGGTSGSISTGALTVNSGGTATTSVVFGISGDNSATNARVVNVNGTLNLAASEYIRTYNLTGGTINAPTAANEFLRTSSAGLFINSLASAATSTINNKVDLTFASATIDTANGTAPNDLTITGVISENSGAGSGAKTITKSGAGTLMLTGVNTFTGNTTITGGTLAIGGAGRLASGTYAGAVAISSVAVFSVESSAAQVLSGVISGQGSLIKSGTGVLTLSGTAINTYTGGTTVNRGTLLLDNANLTTPTDLLNNSNILTLGGGTLTVRGKTGAFATSQSVASTTLNPGASTTRVELNTGTSTTLNLGAITRNQGATLNVTADSNLTDTASTSRIIKTTGITYNGNAVTLPGAGLKKYVGAGFLSNSGTSTRFAQIDEFGQFVAPPAATGWISTGGDTSTVYNASTAGAAAAGATLTGATTMYGTVFNPGSAVTQGLDTFNLTTNGLLNISANTVTISGTGKVLAGAERDLVIHTASTGGFNISSVIDNSAAGTSSLTFSGQSTGVLTLNNTAANTYTGGTFISAGTLSIGTGGLGAATANVAALGTGTVTINPGGILRLWIKNDASFNIANNLSINGGTLRNEDGNHTMTGTVAVGTGGATFQAVWSTKNLAINNAISGSGPVAVEGNAGQVRFLGTNTYTGATTVNNGTLVLSSANASSGFTIASGANLALRTITLGSTQNITGAGNLTKDISTFGASSIAGTNNNYTGTTVVNLDRFTLASGGVINGTSSISVLGQFGALFENLGTVTTPGSVTVNGSSNSSDGLFNNGNIAGTTPGSLTAASITLQNSFISHATNLAHGGEFNNRLNSNVNVGSGAITVNGQGNTLAGGSTTTGSTFTNAGSVIAGSITLNSSSTANTASNKGGTYTQTGGSTALTGALTMAANGGTGVVGTAGNDAAVNLQGGTFTAGSVAVNAGTLSVTAGSLTSTSPISVNGGTLLLGGSGMDTRINAGITIGGSNTPASKLQLGNAVVTETMGTLTLSTGTSVRVIDFGDTAFAQNGRLTFASLTGTAATTLQVWNWSGSVSGGGNDQLSFTSTTPGGGMDLANVSFYSDGGSTLFNGSSGATFLGNELVPVPEPGAISASLLLAGFAFAGSRRQAARRRHTAASQASR